MRILKFFLSFELCVLQWNFFKIQYLSANNSNSFPYLYFLFLDEKKFCNNHIWSTFFKESSDLAAVYVYRSSTDSRIQLEATHVSINETFISESWNTSMSKSIRTVVALHALLQESLNSKIRNAHRDDKFIILSSESIPLKSLSSIRSILFDEDPVYNNTSAFCVKSSIEWELNSKDSLKRLVKHYASIVLTRADAEMFDSKFSRLSSLFSLQNEQGYNSLFSNAATDHHAKAKKLIEYLPYYFIFGENDLNDNSSWHGLHPIANVEQGRCYSYWYSNSTQSDDSSNIWQNALKLNRSLEYGIDITTSGRNTIIQSLRFEVLVALHQSPHFMFASKIHAENAASFVLKPSPTDGTKLVKVTIAEALESLHIIPKSNSSLSGTDGEVSFRNTSRGWSGRHHSNRAGKLKFRRGSGDNTGLKVLMVSVDSRVIKPTLTGKAEDYVSMIAVLQSDYASFHGYDYISFCADHEQLIKLFKEKYPESEIKTKDFEENKYGYASYHPGFKYFRASSWSKLPPLWHLNKEYGSFYDYIWFVDSDATPNPLHRNRSLGDSFQLWKNNTNGPAVYKGVKDPYEATFLFFSNFPWRDDLPCAGTFIFKTGSASDVILREWWDYDIPQKNQADFMEQDALWYQLEAGPEYGFSMNTSVVSLLTENQFPSAWRGVSNLWFTHLPNYESRRINYLRTMLFFRGLYADSSFKAAVEHIQKYSHISGNVLELALEMEALHVKPYRWMYPAVRAAGRADDAWHGVNWRGRPEQPPVGVLFNGFVMGYNGQKEIYLITNNTKRAFPNLDTFVKMGYDMDMVLRYRVNKDREWYIPTGDPLPTV